MLRLAVFSMAAVLAGCGSVGGAALDVAQAYYHSKTGANYQAVPLKPQYTYLEVQADQVSALLVLGQVDTSPENNRAIETWVTAEQQVFRTQSGFFVGATGVAKLPTQVLTAWEGSSPNTAQFSFPPQGLFNVPLEWKAWPTQPVKVNSTPLFKRAQQVQGLVVQAWQGFPVQSVAMSNPHIQPWLPITQIVATDPGTGRLVYGQFCLAQASCVEYLLRTANNNL